MRSPVRAVVGPPKGPPARSMRSASERSWSGLPVPIVRRPQPGHRCTSRPRPEAPTSRRNWPPGWTARSPTRAADCVGSGRHLSAKSRRASTYARYRLTTPSMPAAYPIPARHSSATSEPLASSIAAIVPRACRQGKVNCTPRFALHVPPPHTPSLSLQPATATRDAGPQGSRFIPAPGYAILGGPHHGSRRPA